MTARKGRLYPLRAHTKAEAAAVVAFGFHRAPRRFDDVDGIRRGFVILAGVGLVVLGIVGAAVLLIAYGITHPVAP